MSSHCFACGQLRTPSHHERVKDIGWRIATLSRLLRASQSLLSQIYPWSLLLRAYVLSLFELKPEPAKSPCLPLPSPPSVYICRLSHREGGHGARVSHPCSPELPFKVIRMIPMIVIIISGWPKSSFVFFPVRWL